MPGYFGPINNCTACAPNTYCPGGFSFTPCQNNSSTQGHYQSTNVSACVCNFDYYLDNSTQLCTECADGAYCIDNQQIFCPANSRPVNDDCLCYAGYKMINDECQICSHQELCTGNGVVEICADGANASLHQKCLCATHQHCSNISSCLNEHECIQCPSNSYCVDNYVFECPLNSVAPPESTSISQCICVDGYYRYNDTCIPCPLNSYCHDQARFLCSNYDSNLITSETLRVELEQCHCDIGYFRINKYDLCKLCAKNYYCPSELELKLPNVISCIENAYTLLEGQHQSSHCICDAGTKTSELDGFVKCLPCEEGERCVDGKIVEFQCHLQKRIPNSDHSACVCIDGFYEDASKNCVPCTPGFIKPDIGNHLCTACPVDTYASNSTHCTECGINTESMPGSDTCSCVLPYVGLPGSTIIVHHRIL